MAADGPVGADTRRTLAAGRATVGEILGAAQGYGRRLFVFFLVGLLVTIWAMRVYIWPTLRADLLAREASIVAITPFDVILLQAKLGIIVGILLVIPPLLYYARGPLRRRGLYPAGGVASWKVGVIVLAAAALFVGGAVYAYKVFFPVMFDFLASNAVSAGLAPTYSIVDWTQFILVLGLSFGLAAQLPLAMTALSYAEIVPYETFRDKWKYAVLGMFAFGALFSPPDPFTQLMWAGPLVILYGASLYLARLAVALRRGRAAIDLAGTVRRKATSLAGGFVLAGGLAWWFSTWGYRLLNRGLAAVPAAYRPGPLDPSTWLPLGPQLGPVLLGAGVGLLAVVLLLLYYAWPDLESDTPVGSGTAPAEIDLVELDAAGIRAAPPEAFAGMDEDDAVARAREAMEAGEAERARAILDRFDEVDAEAAAEAAGAGEEQPADQGGDGGFLTRQAAGVMDAFTEEETTEEDVGGYAYDIAFVADSLRSASFRLFAVFGVVMVSVFVFLYSGGIGTIKNDFLRRLPAVVRPEDINIITLHPVEALIFEVKLSTLLGLVATLPLLLYYAWPALKERGLASGDRTVFFGWTGAIVAGVVIGSAVGYLFIAPAVISYLVWDALQANMIIAYRVSNFFWLVFFTTVGIGLLADIPVTMLLFHRGGLVSFRTMRERWRGVLLGVMIAAAVFTPSSALSMVLVTIPVMAAYGLGLGLLWLYTLGGRRASAGAARSD